MNDNRSIGVRLYDLRVKAEYTQEDLAYRLNVSRQSISKWELDKTLPETQKLIDLAQLYNVSLDYIVLGVDSDNEEKDDFSSQSDKSETNTEESDVTESNDTDITQTENQSTEDDTYDNNEIRFRKVLHYTRYVLATVNGIIFLFCIMFVVNMSNLFAYKSNEMESDTVMIDKIYEQYTYADITKFDDNGGARKERVWLDTIDVSEGDYIFSYSDNGHPDQIKFEYYRKTLMTPVVVMCVFGVLFLYFVWEIRNERKAL